MQGGIADKTSVLNSEAPNAIGPSERAEHRIPGPAPGPRLALRLGLAPDPLQHRAKLLPRDDGVDLDQRVTLGIQARVAV